MQSILNEGRKTYDLRRASHQKVVAETAGCGSGKMQTGASFIDDWAPILWNLVELIMEMEEGFRRGDRRRGVWKKSQNDQRRY